MSPPRMSNNTLQHFGQFLITHWMLLVAVLLFFALGLARTNDLSIYTDSTRYLIWGNSFAHGKGFVDDTQPVPEHYVVNAPLYAVFLAPVLLAFPLSLLAAKIWTLLWGMLGLILLYRWLLRFADPSSALAAVLFLAVNPLMLVISTEVLSEASFVVLVLSTFILAEKIESSEGSRKCKIALIAILSIVMLLREIGAALVMAFTLFFVFKKRYKDAVIVLFAAGFLFGLWTIRNTVLVGVPTDDQAPNLKFFFGHFVTPPDASLASEFLGRVAINLQAYFGESGGSLLYRFPMNLLVFPGSAFAAASGIVSSMNIILALLMAAVVIVGVRADLRTSRTSSLRLMFLLFYTGIILLYPVHDIRFQLPLLPLVLFYILRVLELARSALVNKGVKARGWAVGFVLLLVAIPNLLCCYEVLHTNLSYRAAPRDFWRSDKVDDAASYFATPWSEMAKLISPRVRGSGIIATSEKEIVPFAAEFKFLEIIRGIPLPMLEGMLRTNSVSFLVCAESYGGVQSFEVTLSSSRRFRLELTDSVAGLKLYKVHSRLREPSSSPQSQVLQMSTLRVADLMLLGRLALQSERYRDALSFFSQAREQFKQQPEIAYYILITHALAGDSLEAVEELPRLYATAGGTSFVPPARVFLYSMNELKRARAASDPRGSSERMFDVARMVWSLGYGRQAYGLVKELLSHDPNHFVGLLWAWHWGIQLGDTTGSAMYLKRLQGIDSANAVVRSFTAMTRMVRDLRRATSPADKCRLHLSLASEYARVELPEEAFDEAERALRAEPASIEAQRVCDELLSKRK